MATLSYKLTTEGTWTKYGEMNYNGSASSVPTTGACTYVYTLALPNLSASTSYDIQVVITQNDKTVATQEMRINT